MKIMVILLCFVYVGVLFVVFFGLFVCFCLCVTWKGGGCDRKANLFWKSGIIKVVHKAEPEML